MPAILWSKPLVETTPAPPGALTAIGDTWSTMAPCTVGPLREGKLDGALTQEFAIVGGVRAGAYGASSVRDEIWTRTFSGLFTMMPDGPNESPVQRLTPFARGVGFTRLHRRVPDRPSDYLLLPPGGPPNLPERVFDALYDTNRPTSTAGWLSLAGRSLSVPGFLIPTLSQWNYGLPIGSLPPHHQFFRAWFRRWLPVVAPPLTPGTAATLQVTVKVELGPLGGPAWSTDHTRETASMPAVAPPTVPAAELLQQPLLAFGASPITPGAVVAVSVGMPVELRVQLQVQVVVTTFVLPPAALCFAAPGLSSEVELHFDETQAPSTANHLSVGFTVT